MKNSEPIGAHSGPCAPPTIAGRTVQKAKATASDVIAASALGLALCTSVVQCSDRDLSYRVQLFSTRAESQRNVIIATENLISTRQELMVAVDNNIYSPAYADILTREEVISDAVKVRPIFAAFGAFQAAIQGEIGFWTEKATLQDLETLSRAGHAAVDCFLLLGSRSHKLDELRFAVARTQIRDTCKAQNMPGALDGLKVAEAAAQASMTLEAKRGGRELLPRLGWLSF